MTGLTNLVKLPGYSEMVDPKTRSQYNNTCLSWNDRFPPLNLWNYNLYWRWAAEWPSNIETATEDTDHVDAH